MGSGSFDPLLGIMIKEKWGRFSVFGSSTYKLTTRNRQGTDFGDFWENQLLASYSFQKKAIENDSSSVSKKSIIPGLQLGMNTAYLAQQQNAESIVLHTGYTRIFASAGAVVNFFDRFTLNLLVDIPVYERVIGYQNDSSIRIRTTLITYLNRKK